MQHARKDENCIQYSGWKTSRDATTRKTWARWEDNIRMYLRETEWEGVDWIHLALDRTSGGLL
jgi:hypothetical protein